MSIKHCGLPFVEDGPLAHVAALGNGSVRIYWADGDAFAEVDMVSTPSLRKAATEPEALVAALRAARKRHAEAVAAIDAALASCPPRTSVPERVDSLLELHNALRALRVEGFVPRAQIVTVATFEGWPIGSHVVHSEDGSRWFVEGMTEGDTWRYRVLLSAKLVAELQALPSEPT